MMRPRPGRNNAAQPHLVGLRELKEHTSQIVHRVRETGEPVDVTYCGKIIARIVPLVEDRPKLSPEEWLRQMEEFANELSAVWPKGVSAVEAIREQRKDL